MTNNTTGGNINSTGATSAAMDRAKEAIRRRKICLKFLNEFVMNEVLNQYIRLLLYLCNIRNMNIINSNCK